MGRIRHRFVALDYMNGRLHHVDESNRAADWSVPSGGTLQDMQLAGNGQVIVSLNDGWSFRRLADGSEVSRVKTAVVGIAALRLLAGGGVLAGVNTGEGIELVQFDAKGNTLRCFKLHEYRDLRQLRKTPQGSWLVAYHHGAVEVMLTEPASVLGAFSAPGVKYAYQALRTAAGNTWLSGGYSQAVVELSPENRVIRSFTAVQPPGFENNYYSGFQVLGNGHLVQANWNGHNDGDYKPGLQLFEFDAQGNTVWSWMAPKEQVGSITAFIVLDELDIATLNDGNR